VVCLPAAAHNNAELQMLSTQASQDSFWSETASQEQAQQLRELQQLRDLQQWQLLQHNAQQPANQLALQSQQPQQPQQQ